MSIVDSILWDSKEGNWSQADDGSITVNYLKGKYGSRAGAHFRAQPQGFPGKNARVSYKVWFPQDFDFVKGGKLPGVWGGMPGTGGGKWNDDGFSCRVMFREGGEAVAYVYLCTDQGKYDGDASCPLMKNQGKGFDDIAHHTKGTGIDLWRGQGLQFKRGAWNTVVVHVTVNTPGKADGLVSLEVNGKKCAFDKVCWCAKPKRIEGIVFSSWMGGGSKEYAPKGQQQAVFKEMVVS